MLRQCNNISYGGGGGSGVADNLGNHTATQNLNLAGFSIINLGPATLNSATGILVVDGGEVKVRDVSTIGGGVSFSCSSLSSCSISGLSDVNYLTNPTNGQILMWSGAQSAFVPQTPFSSFSISDGTFTQPITNGNTIIFSPSGDLSLKVTATDTVTIGFAETLTSLTYTSGTNTLSYTDENGNINNIALANVSGGVGGPETLTTLILQTSGTGTHLDPITACNIRYTNENSQVTTIDNRSTIFWNQGQSSALIADDIMVNQPRFICPSGQTVEICKVYVTLGKPGNTDTTIQASILNSNGSFAPTPGSPSSILTLGSGEVVAEWSALAGTILTSMQHVQTRVDTAGDQAENLNIQFWGKTCLCS